MGATLSNDSRSDIRSDQIKLKELNPSAIAKLKQTFQKGSSVNLDKRQAMSILNISQRETDILFDYFDMDGNGQIDSYELTCAIAMLVHSSIDLRAEFLFKLYDFDQNNFLSRDELIHLVRAMIISKGRPVIASDVESKTDDFLRTADLDMDKKISLKEFQSYAAKNREVFSILDAYSPLLTNNPIGASSSSKGKEGKNSRSKREKKNEDDENEVVDKDDEGGDEEGGDFEEEDTGEGDEGMDPDLLAELNKEKEANFRTEEQEERKKGVDFGNGFVVEEAQEGDEFGALKPWLTAVVNTVPSNYKPSKLDGTTPDANLDLEFVHGYRCHDTRNNLRYTANGDFVYHTAAVGIVYNKEEHKQKFLIEHFDDITALAIHPNKKIVATGEIGPYPLISIWDTETCQALVRIREPLQKGINHLAFSTDGKYLVATAADDDHNVAVFEWEKGKAEDLSQITDHRLRMKKGQPQFKGPVVGTCKGGRANILGVCFNKTGDTLACACVKEVNIIKITPGKMRKTKCSGLRGANLTSIMCCGYLKNTLLCGSLKGKLLLFAGTNFTKELKAHSSSLNSIWIRENDLGFLTGGNDGVILTWDSKYQITNRVSIVKPEVQSLCPRIRSLCEDSDGNLLVGLRGGEILEVSNGTPKVYLRGHWDKELWGLCVHPSKDQYYTVGEDKLLGVWDVQTRELVQYCVLEEPATSIDISPNGKELAIGCESGNLYIYDAVALKKKYMKTENVRKHIEDLKYSPDGSLLAVGGLDKDTDGFSHIFIYDCTKKYKRLRKCKGHTSRITHIDWSEDGEYLQSNSTSYELLFHSAETGVQIVNISSLRDVDWHTWTCVLGWPVQGIWPPFAAGDDVNACDVDKTKRVIVTSDDYSKVKLFRYPSPVEKAAYNQYNGHSSHVTCVRFTSNNKHVISTGGNDKAIFQFKFAFDNEGNENEEVEYEEEGEEEEELDEKDEYYDYKVEEAPEGDEAGASKAWIGEMQHSSPKIKITKAMGKAPPQNIRKLNYVFGYRAFDSRNNIKYIGDGNSIVYTTAALGIVLNKKNLKQKYFIYHNEDIVSLDLHPNLRTVATGQMAAKGEARAINLFVWDSSDLPDETNVEWNERQNIPKGVSNLKGRLLRAIRILKFSPDGNKLVGNGEDDNNSIAVFDTSNVNKPVFVGLVKVDQSRVLDIAWINNDEFVSVGSKHIKFFKINGRNIKGTKGNFGKVKNESLVSVVCAFGKVFTGGLKGNIIKWESGTASTSKNICKNGPVYVLQYNARLKLLFSGGYDGIIIAFDSAKLNEAYRIDIQKITKSQTECGIRAIDINDKDEMVVGTKGGEIVEISLTTKQMIKSLMKSHYLKELWALTVNPTNSLEVATGGGDQTLRIWDIKKHTQKSILFFPEDFRAIDWSSDGKFIVIGTMPGLIYYVDVKTMKSSTAFKSIFYKENQKKEDKDKWIQELKISPNAEYVAFGSHCGLGNTFSKIQVLQVTGNSKNPLKAYLIIDPKITSALTHLDWAEDNDRIVCNSLAFELKYVSLGAKKVIRSSSCVYEDGMWHTWTCLFGFPVQGIWEPATTNYSVNYTCMNSTYKVIATGDDFSKVKLFKSPCVVEHADYKAYGGHSSHIPKVRFTPNDKYLISVGGNDKSVFIWETDFGQGGEEEEGEGEGEGEEDNEPEDEEEEPAPPKKKSQTQSNKKKRPQPIEEEEDEEEEPKPPKKKSQTQNKKKRRPQPEEEDEEPEPEPEPEEEDEPAPPKKKGKKKKTKQIEEDPEPEPEPEEEEEPAPPKKKGRKKKTKQIEEDPEPEPEEEEEPAPPKKKGRKKAEMVNVEENENDDEPEEEPKPSSKNKKRHNEDETIKTNKNNVFNEDLYDDIGTQSVNPNAQFQSWKQSSLVPDNIEAPNTEKPNINLVLNHVFGYRTKDTRNNVQYLNENTIIYHGGKLGIVQNLSTGEQKFFSNHKEEILALAVNNDKDLIVTAEAPNKTNKSQIIFWEPNTLNINHHVEVLLNGIMCIAISPSSSQVVAVGLDDKHTLILINVNEENIVTQVENGKKKTLSCIFGSENEFVTVGVKQYKYWTIKNGNELIAKEGVFGEQSDKKLGIVNKFNDLFVTGSSTGEIGLWEKNIFKMGKKVHSQAVDTIFTNDKVIISGERNMSLAVMDKDLTLLRKIQLDLSSIGSINPIPKSIDMFGNNNTKILIGTLAGEIFELHFEPDYLSGEMIPKFYNNSHFVASSNEINEITSILYWKSKNLMITTGNDCTIRFWNIDQNKQENYLKLQNEIDNSEKLNPTASDLSPNEEVLIVGFSSGNITTYKTKDFSVSNNMQFRQKPISIIKYSPDGHLIAAGSISETGKFTLDIINNLSHSLVHSFEDQQDLITRIDWSQDSQYISCSSQNEEVEIYNVKKKVKLDKTDVVKNEEWNTWTQNFGWPLSGYYNSGGSKIIACERYEKTMKGDKIIAIGNENGEVRIYKYPILGEQQQFSIGDINHADKVSNVKFALTNSGEKGILFTSGNDGCLYKWDLQ